MDNMGNVTDDEILAMYNNIISGPEELLASKCPSGWQCSSKCCLYNAQKSWYTMPGCSDDCLY